MIEQISFPAADGSALAATLNLPSGKGKVKMALLLHGWNSARQTMRNTLLSSALEKAGIGTLSIDFRGHGESGGDINQVTVVTEAEDILAANAHLGTIPRANLSGGIGIVGASIGGSAALYSMSVSPSAFRCGVLLAPRLDFSDVAEDMYCFGEGKKRVENRQMLPVGKDIDFFSLARAVTADVLLIHGSKDEFISIGQSRKLAILYPKRFELREIEGADHVMQAQTASNAEEAADFLIDYLGV